MFENYNQVSKRTIKEGITTEGMTFKPLKDFCGKELVVDGFFFTEGRYGKQAVIIADGFKINLPKRYVDVFTKIRDDQAQLDAVLAGHMALTNIRMLDAKEGKTAAFDFKDI